jgi:hypothetical protein
VSTKCAVQYTERVNDPGYYVLYSLVVEPLSDVLQGMTAANRG